MAFPNSIFLYRKSPEEGEEQGDPVYINNPIRTVRDIIEYSMVPFQIAGGKKPEVLHNKLSPTMNFVSGKMSGQDWAGRPLGNAGDVAADTAAMAMPAPAGDMPRYALEAWRSGEGTYLTEGIKRMFDPETAIPTLLGLQPHVASKDPTITQEAMQQSSEEKELWARVSRVKQLSKRLPEEVRERQIEDVLNEARALGMQASKIREIGRVMRNQGISRAQQGAAARYQGRQEPKENQLEAPPGDL